MKCKMKLSLAMLSYLANKYGNNTIFTKTKKKKNKAKLKVQTPHRSSADAGKKKKRKKKKKKTERLKGERASWRTLHLKR